MYHNYSPGRHLNNYGTLWAGAAIYQYIYICVYVYIHICMYPMICTLYKYMYIYICSYQHPPIMYHNYLCGVPDKIIMVHLKSSPTDQG